MFAAFDAFVQNVVLFPLHVLDDLLVRVVIFMLAQTVSNLVLVIEKLVVHVVVGRRAMVLVLMCPLEQICVL